MKEKVKRDFKVLTEKISPENIAVMAELIAMRETKTLIGFMGYHAEKAHKKLCKDIFCKDMPGYTLSDSYDLVQNAALFLCNHCGEYLDDFLYISAKGKQITIKMECNRFNKKPYFEGTPKEQLDCLNHAVEYVQATKDLEDRFMAVVKRMKEAYNLCSGGDELTDAERDLIHFYMAVRAVLYKLTKPNAPDAEQMNKRVARMVEEAIQAEGVTELFTIGKETERVQEDIFSDEYIERINRIPMVNTKIKLLQKLLRQAIDSYRRVNKIKGIDFTKRMTAIVDMYNARRKDKAFANEVLDDVAEQLTKLPEELGKDKQSFEDLHISFEEKAFFDILVKLLRRFVALDCNHGIIKEQPHS